MRELKELLNVARRLDEIDEQIISLKSVAYSPKNQVITGMPRGGKSENPIEKYVVKIEKLEKRKETLIAYQLEEWYVMKFKLKKFATDEEIHLMFARFVKGLSWEKAVNELNDKFSTDWGINKAFRVYGKIKKKLKYFE